MAGPLPLADSSEVLETPVLLHKLWTHQYLFKKILGVGRSVAVLLPTSKENDHERKNI